MQCRLVIGMELERLCGCVIAEVTLALHPCFANNIAVPSGKYHTAIALATADPFTSGEFTAGERVRSLPG